jgi:ATP-binding cassette subfamily B protein
MENKFGGVPEHIKPLLQIRNIEPDKVIACTAFDRDLEFNNCDGYIFFTEKTLYTLMLEPLGKNEKEHFHWMHSKPGYQLKFKQNDEFVNTNNTNITDNTDNINNNNITGNTNNTNCNNDDNKSKFRNKFGKKYKANVSNKSNDQLSQVIEFKEYDISRIKSIEIFSQVVGGLILIEYEDYEQSIAAFSNSCQKAVFKMKSLIDKQIKNEEFKDTDFIDNDSKGVCPKCNLPYPDENRKICPKCMDKRSLFIRVLSYFKPYKIQFAGIVACIFLYSGISVVIPYLSGKVLYDQVLSSKINASTFFLFKGRNAVASLLILVLAILVVRLLQQGVGIIHGRLVAGFVPKAIFNLKTDIYKSMQNLSLSFFNQKQTGSLLTRVQSDSAEVTSFFIDGLPYFLINIIILVSSAAVMFSMNPILTVFALGFIPILLYVSYRMIPRLWHMHGKRHRSLRNMNAAVSDNLTGARVVKAFGQEISENERFKRISGRVRDSELDLVDYDNRFFGLFSTVETITSIVIWGLGSWLILNKNGGMTYGTLITFVGYAAMLNGPLDFMSFMFRWWSQSLNSAQRIFEIIDAVPEISQIKDPVRKAKISGDIEVRNVSFSYNPAKNVLENISFKVKAGEFFGIVGQSGAGKTTMINLISRFYDPKEGEIFIDGIPIKSMAFEDLRKNIAIVSQDTFIFKGTLAANIAYAKPDCSRQDILFASMAASAHDFISKLPHGYDTVVGTGGKELSGGEKQRISIARAILADPQVLILDEATASVDTLTEQKIQKALKYLIRDRTTISIAHRLSSLKEADHMIVLEDSKIVEEGTHSELFKNKGTYHKLMQLQTKALALRGE